MVIWVNTFSDKLQTGESWSLEELEKIPHLRAIAKAIRDVIGTTNKVLSDVKLQNELEFDNFIAWINNNLIARLIVTQQYHELFHLLQDPSEKAKWVYLLEEMRREERALHLHQRLGQTFITPMKIGGSNIPSYGVSMHAMFIWTHPDPNLPPIKQWQHYQRELQRINFDYHRESARVHHELLQADLDHIRHIRHNLAQDPVKNHEALQDLEIRDIVRWAEEVLKTLPVKPDGTMDVQKAAEQVEQIQSIRKAVAGKSDNFHTNIDNYKLDPSQKSAIQKDRVQRNEKIEQGEKKLLDLKKAHEEASAPLVANIHAKKTEAKLNVKEQLNALCQIIEKQEDQKTLPERMQLVGQLKQWSQDIDSLQQFEAVQEVLQQCHQTLQQSEHLIQAKTEFQASVAALQEMMMTPDPLIAPEINPIAQLNSNALPPVESKLGQELPYAENKYAFGFSSEEQRQKQMDMKEKLNAGRQESKEAAQDLVNPQQKAFTETCTKLIETWDNFKKINQFSEEDASLIEETDRLLREISSDKSPEGLDNTAKLELINKNLFSLEGEYEEMDNILEKIALLDDYFQQPSEPELLDSSIISGPTH